jgi:hypothetical protein
MTARTGSLGQGIQDKIAGTGKIRQDGQIIAARTGQLGMDNKDRTTVGLFG